MQRFQQCYSYQNAIPKMALLGLLVGLCSSYCTAVIWNSLAVFNKTNCDYSAPHIYVNMCVYPNHVTATVSSSMTYEWHYFDASKEGVSQDVPK